MEKKNNIFRFIKNILQDKCPKCKEGLAFQKNDAFFEIPKMNNKCPNCSYKFEREPGYFIGAMYLSYGLALLQGGIVYLFMLLFFPSLPIGWMISIVVFTFILFAKKNFKWSRLLYIYIFPW